jgi:hypothetical protein
VVSLEVSIDGGNTFTSNGLTFSYYGTCPNACSGPTHGGCSMGVCSCAVQWSGSDCSVPQFAPVFANPAYTIPSNIVEGLQFNSGLPSFTQGSAPLYFALYNAPSGMIINSTTGQVIWPTTVSSNTPYSFTVYVSNAVGSTTATVSFMVQFSYTATLFPISPTYSPQVAPAAPLLLTGNASYLATGQPAAGKQVSVTIVVRGLYRTLTANVANNGKFQVYFTPSSTDAGIFTAWASNINDLSIKPAQVTFTIIGGTLSSYGGSLNVRVNTTFNGTVTSLNNIGDTSLTGISVSIVGTGPGIQVFYSLANVGGADGATLVGQQSAPLNLIVMATAGLTDTVGVRFTTNEGVQLLYTVFISARVDMPSLSSQPSTLSATVVQGQQSLLSVQINNNGLASTGVLNILLPPLSFLTLASPSSGELASLAPGQFSLIQLLLTPLSNETVQTISTSLVVSNAAVSLFIPLSVQVLSNGNVTFSVLVRDEAYYFSQGSPNLANASVSIYAPVTAEGIISLHGITDASGLVTFTNIPIGYYSVYVQKLGHSTFQTALQVDGSVPVLTAFISIQAVSYTW